MATRKKAATKATNPQPEALTKERIAELTEHARAEMEETLTLQLQAQTGIVSVTFAPARAGMSLDSAILEQLRIAVTEELGNGRRSPDHTAAIAYWASHEARKYAQVHFYSAATLGRMLDAVIRLAMRRAARMAVDHLESIAPETLRNDAEREYWRSFTTRAEKRNSARDDMLNDCMRDLYALMNLRGTPGAPTRPQKLKDRQKNVLSIFENYIAEGYGVGDAAQKTQATSQGNAVLQKTRYPLKTLRAWQKRALAGDSKQAKGTRYL